MNIFQSSHYSKSKKRLLHTGALVGVLPFIVLTLQPAFGLGTLTTLVNFNGTNGSTPSAGVTLATNGNLYGTASAGGSSNNGTAFKLSAPGFTVLTTLVNFTGTAGANVGASPIARLTQASNGSLYGSTNLGGTTNKGTLFKLASPAFTARTTLATFTGTAGATKGANPAGRVIEGPTGQLWGTTATGGTANKGTIFKTTLTGSPFTTVVSLNGTTNGSTPLARLQLGSDSNYYGTASTGGASNKGTVFKVTPAGVLSAFSFSGTNGASPESGLVEISGFLFGTTRLGGASNKGAIFKFSLGGGTPVLVASFTGTNGSNPVAAVTKGSDGNYYGTTTTGGINNKGVIYRLVGNTITKLFDFNGTTNGQNPESTLVPAPAGLKFYGTTSAGGSGTKGTVFSYSIP